MKNGFKIPDINTATQNTKAVLFQVREHYQFVPNALGAMAESPEAVKSYLALDELANQNSLSDEQRHIAFLTIAREYDCAYCVAAHTAFAQMGRVDDKIVQALRNNQALNSAKLNALQDFVSLLIKKEGQLTELEVENFLSHGYTRQNILELIAMIANKLIAVFANRIMGTDLDSALQPAKWNRVA
ncbi:MAG: carboxymuconolactone decarboxylase family protein [Gammaproteobacteria bacterium]|nr:carboxymuconolactone decarboxylase family protein [Gammaproteobacteria bacterium]